MGDTNPLQQIAEQGQNILGGMNSVVQTIKSNLSKTAELVNNILVAYISPAIRSKELVKNANDLIKDLLAGKISPEGPELVKFSTDWRKEMSEIYEQTKKDNCSDKELAVVTNYGAKFVNIIKSYNYKTKDPAQISPEKLSA